MHADHHPIEQEQPDEPLPKTKDARPWENMPWVQHEIRRWADATFGTDRTAYMALAKLVLEEIPEMLEYKRLQPDGPDLGGEVADIFILLMDVAEMWGIDLATAIQNKMAINYGRTWKRGHSTGNPLTYRHEERIDAPNRRTDENI